MRFLIPYLRRHLGELAAGFLFTVLTAVTSLLAPWVLKYAIDDLQAGVRMRRLLLYAGLILGVAVVQGVFRFLMRLIVIGVSRRIEYRLRLDIFDHLQRLPLEFYGANSTGDIITRASSDLDNVRLFLGPGLMNLVSTAVLFTTAILFMSSLSPRLTLVSLLPLPAATLLMARASALYYRRYRAVREAEGRMSSQCQESFSGARVVKAYAQEGHQEELYRRRSEEYRDQNLGLARVFGLFHPLVGFVVGLAAIVVLWAGGRMIIRGEISLGDLVAFLGFMAMLIYPTVALGWVINLFQRGAASVARIRWIMDTVPAVSEPVDPAPADEVSGRVTFQGITFAYPGTARPVLRGIDLDIRPGMKVAVVGRTGSGKSTLVSLIPRLYNPPPGSLLVDGTDVNRLPLRLLRRSVGLVPQETFLFSETIGWNIALGVGAARYSTEEAARLAGMEPDVDNFPQRFDTVVGERGITLSGGQKQRTALARALVRDPRILILDDAFSSVDAATEREVLENLRGVMAGRTTVIVTHRLASIADADLIVVLEEGGIAERGTHAELMDRGGWYAGMYRRQMIIEELEREEGA